MQCMPRTSYAYDAGEDKAQEHIARIIDAGKHLFPHGGRMPAQLRTAQTGGDARLCVSGGAIAGRPEIVVALSA